MARFGAIDFCIAEQFEGKSQPPYGALLQPRDFLSARGQSMDRFLESLNRLVGADDQSEASKAAGPYRDIRLSTSAFLGHTHDAYRVLLAKGPLEPSTFLDVRCGAGQKVLLARSFFDQAGRVELDVGYAAAAQRLFRRMGSPARAFKEDSVEFNGYGEYRPVYIMRPMKDPDGLLRLEERMVQGVRPGTIPMAPYSGFADRAESYGVHPIDGALFHAGTSSDDAAALREEAERTGTFVAHGQPPVTVDAVWQQLVVASWMRGYHPFPKTRRSE